MTVKKPLFYKGFGRCDFKKFEKNEENQGKVVVFMDIVAFIEEYFGIQLLTYQKLQLRMLMMEYAKYE